MKPNRKDEATVGPSARPEERIAGAPLCVADVMTRQVVTLSPHHTFADAVQIMSSHLFRHFVVTETDSSLAGVISDRDLLRTLARTPDWQTKFVGQFMSRDVVTVKPDTELSLAVGKILSKRINCLPVVDDSGKLCGIVTSTDLLKAYRKIQESLERRASAATSKVSGT